MFALQECSSLISQVNFYFLDKDTYMSIYNYMPGKIYFKGKQISQLFQHFERKKT